jgi:hypothetical protein
VAVVLLELSAEGNGVKERERHTKTWSAATLILFQTNETKIAAKRELVASIKNGDPTLF